MGALYTLDRLRSEYIGLFDRMEITNSKIPAAKQQALRIIRSKDRYKAVEAKTTVPWFVVGCLHMRESDADFGTWLHNGDKMRAKDGTPRPTHNVPAGRPPDPSVSWEDGAYDAMVTVENLDDIKNWGPEHVAYAAEKFNGWGYRNPGRNIPSPYLWGGTSVQKPGKFVTDGKYDAGVMDQQIGAMATLRMLMDLDPDVVFAGAPIAPPAPEAVVVPADAPAPLSPRADDTESNVKPLSKSITLRGLFLKATGAVGLALTPVFDFLKTPFGFATFSLCLVAVCAGFVMVIKGRYDVNNLVKHLSLDDTA